MAKKKPINNKEIEENEIDVKVDDFADELALEVIYKGTNEYMHISTFNLNRPGLQLAGYYDHFGAERVQLIGEMETAYLSQLEPEKRIRVLKKLFKYEFPCLVVSSVPEILPEIIECAKEFDRVVLKSPLRTTMIMHEMSIFLGELLAPTEVIHAVLMDLYGVGVLITGRSSVGKSETALELIQRNHRLVADDAVCIKRVNNRLVGSSPSIIRHFMEVRGIGIIDVRQMYGAGSVKLTKMIDIAIKLETWDNTKDYDRLGNVEESFTVLDVDIPLYTIPVKPGRNLAAILEVAARNHRLKDMGYDTLAELDRRMNESRKED